MAKTLVDFRAEQGLYLKDLAAILEISEDELRTIEESGTVPAEIGQRLILHYAWPEDYFSIPAYNHGKTSKMKKTPEGVSFVLCCTALIDATLKKSIKSMAFGYLRQFHVHPK